MDQISGFDGEIGGSGGVRGIRAENISKSSSLVTTHASQRGCLDVVTLSRKCFDITLARVFQKRETFT